MSDCFRPHGLQHARLTCPSPTLRAYSNSHPLYQWCYLTISSSIAPFSSWLQSFLASGSFPMSHFFPSKYWSFSFSISPSNDYSRLISIRTEWLNLAVQGTLKNLLQHHSSKASILWCSAFFIVQLSHPYMTTGKTITLTRRTFVVMSLLFNRLSRLVKTFFPRSKRLLISWLQSLPAVILEPPKIKSATVSTVSPSISHDSMPANLENSAVATGLEKVSFHSNPKERQCQRMLKLLHNCTHLTR